MLRNKHSNYFNITFFKLHMFLSEEKFLSLKKIKLTLDMAQV